MTDKGGEGVLEGLKKNGVIYEQPLTSYNVTRAVQKFRFLVCMDQFF